jgi:hypothetical protein
VAPRGKWTPVTVRVPPDDTVMAELRAAVLAMRRIDPKATLNELLLEALHDRLARARREHNGGRRFSLRGEIDLKPRRPKRATD